MASAEREQIYEEARSVLASIIANLITQLVAFARAMYNYAVTLSQTVIQHASTNPLALTLLIANTVIWVM